ncbi:hypothetical protein SHELI_v1c03620 [Spiroplasma helicoides]|uniref:MtN3 and saliva related transmembrane protein n=1 Tax=Spiroplasma helicoides TaxID=216938 RepID=A0A1B3SK67_9MOLU|nr:SemiSWEET family transporter [Spiroplasma helicoides]AOG60317.1 hypothetical protein SHELI_v1c03620 [Spiroplasma helicoides]
MSQSTLDIIGNVIGWLGFTTSLTMLLPQVIKVMRTRDTKSLSLIMFILTFLNAVLWFAYGLLIAQMQLYIANACALVASLIIIGYILANHIKAKKQKNNQEVDELVSDTKSD